jgi:hypothetical protein
VLVHASPSEEQTVPSPQVPHDLPQPSSPHILAPHSDVSMQEPSRQMLFTLHGLPSAQDVPSATSTAVQVHVPTGQVAVWQALAGGGQSIASQQPPSGMQ